MRDRQRSRTAREPRRSTALLEGKGRYWGRGKGFGWQNCGEEGRKQKTGAVLSCSTSTGEKGRYVQAQTFFSLRKFHVYFYSCLFPSLQQFSHLYVYPASHQKQLLYVVPRISPLLFVELLTKPFPCSVSCSSKKE